jgi:regulator of cell morphogenesis and NO signaling
MNTEAQCRVADRRFDDSIGWLDSSLTDLVGHIQRRHHERLRLELPRSLAKIAQVESQHGDRHATTLTPLRHLFDRFSRGLLLHIREEDAVLFPAIVAIEAAFANQRTRPWTDIGPAIELMEADHANALESLTHMRLLTRGWAIPDDGDPAFRGLYEGLLALDRDLHVHVHLENHVLFPRAIALARMVGARTACATSLQWPSCASASSRRVDRTRSRRRSDVSTPSACHAASVRLTV